MAFKNAISGLIIFGLSLGFSTSVAQEREISLGLPIDCELGETCFIQQMTDMDVSDGISDPYCGIAAYNGHKGTDIRLPRLTDMNERVEVLASASGVVRGTRNNMDDNLVRTREDRARVGNQECGNGLLLDHGNGIETQYCHMMKGSIAVQSGQRVKKGDVLGFVGLSGLTQFPHIHLAVRKDGKIIDPFTGATPEDGCAASNNMWWDDKKIVNFTYDAQLLDMGISGDVVKHANMVVRKPPDLMIGDEISIGWVWYANLRDGDQVQIAFNGPNGPLGESLTDPIERNKASWSGFVGKRRAPERGQYLLETYILRDGEKIRRQTRIHRQLKREPCGSLPSI